MQRDSSEYSWQESENVLCSEIGAPLFFEFSIDLKLENCRLLRICEIAAVKATWLLV